MAGRNKNKAKKAKNQMVKRNGVPHPPKLNMTTVVTRTFRFVSPAMRVQASVTVNDFLDLLCMATSATAAYRLLDSFTLKSIECWGLAVLSGATPNTLSVVLGGGATFGMSGQNDTWTDTCTDVSRGPHVKVNVSPKDQVGQVQNTSSTARMIYMDLPAGTVVDIKARVHYRETVAALVVGSVAGATVGTPYVRALNSNSSSADWLIPQGVATI